MKNNSVDISFYRLTTLPIIKAAPKLIEKIYYSGQKLIVLTEDEQLTKTIDGALWAYSTKHFIPHGTNADEHPDDQPVYITHAYENPNDAKIIMIVGKAEVEEKAGVAVDKLIYLFDGNYQDQLEFARVKWKEYQKNGNPITYWRQNMDGAWEKQA